MSITNYPDADFTPDIPNSGANTGKQSYNPTGSFRFWAQKVLPTVYDDSLSYYEILTKVVNYLNAVIQNVDSLNDSVDNTNSAFDTLQGYVNDTKDTIVSAYNELQSYVNTYFDSLDVQEEINNKLDAMASDGSLSELLSPFIPSLVSDWLSENITPTSPAIDASLSVSGAGADAKIVGDKFKTIKENIDDISEPANYAYNLIPYTGTGIEFTDTDIILTALTDGTYKYAYTDIDTSNINNITISWSNATGDNAVLRYGTVENGQVEWGDWIATNRRNYVINCESDDTVRVAVYLTTSTSVAEGAKAIFTGLQIENGTSATEFTNKYLTAFDNKARNIASNNTENISKITSEGVNLIYSDTTWSGSASVAKTDTEITITALSEGTYRTASTSFETNGKNNVTISYTNIEPSTAKIRYGHDVDGRIEWDGYANTSPTTIDVSNYDNFRIGFYIGTSTQIEVGDSATFTGVQVEYGDEATPFSNVTISANDIIARNAINELNNDVRGTGNTIYYGEKINLKTSDMGFKCNSETWLNMTSEDITGLADYGLNNNQSLAIFNGTLFLLQNGGGIVAIDMTSKNIIGSGSFAPTTYQHANASEFTNIYYENNDTYPLLMVSRCGNVGTTSGETNPNADAAEFYRISITDNIITCTLINTIVLNINTYGIDWSIDNVNQWLVACYHANGNYTITDNNPTIFAVFSKPTATEIKSGNRITLSESDILKYFELKHFTFQAMKSHGGLAYTGATISNLPSSVRQRIYVVNIEKGMIVSDIVLGETKECEGVSVYNEKLYISFRTNSDTTGTNPVKINEYSF